MNPFIRDGYVGCFTIDLLSKYWLNSSNMATIKAILWTHQPKSDKTYPIRLRITKDRKTSYISIGYSIKESDWDSMQGKVKKSFPNSVRLNNLITQRMLEAQSTSIEMETKDPSAGVQKIALKLKRKGGTDFFAFAEMHMEKYNNDEKWGTYNSYCTAINKFKEFLGKSTNNHLITRLAVEK